MEVYHYHQFPEHLSSVYITLFDNVTNAADLRTRLIQAATLQGPEGDAERETVNFAFIDARLVRIDVWERKIVTCIHLCRLLDN